MNKKSQVYLYYFVAILIFSSGSVAQILDDVVKAEAEIRQSCKTEIKEFCKDRSNDFEDLVNCLGHSRVKDEPCFRATGKYLAFTLSDNKKVGRYNFPKGSSLHRQRGKLYFAEIPVNWDFNGIRCKQGSVWLQDPNPWGSDMEVFLSRCFLDGVQTIGGIQFMQWPESISTVFSPVGTVSEGCLAADQAIKGVLYKKGYIKFSEKGDVLQNNPLPTNQPVLPVRQIPVPAPSQPPAPQNPPTKLGQAEVVNGVWVPAAPDKVANSSLVGVDSNGNGVRDDAERLLGARFGKLGNTELLDLARSYQKFITTPLHEVASLTKLIEIIQSKKACLPKALLSATPDAAKWVEHSVLNTLERVKAFSDRVARIKIPSLSNSNCAK